MANNITEDLFAAMDTIISEKVKALNYNITIRCQITNADNSEKGEYTVTDGNNTFTAYSETTTYKVDNYVYVVIPNGDYTQTKTIIGKYVTADSTIYTYIKPTENYVDITGNLLDVDDTIYSLKANGEDKEVVIQRISVNEAGYDRLAVKGSFESWLNSYNLTSGDYGLRVDLVEEVPTTISTSQYKYYSYELGTKNMYGSVYNFDTFYEQEALFDISNISNIIQLRLVFYQKNNFANSIGLISAQERADDLFATLPSVSLGYDLSNYDDNKVLLYSLSSKTYSEYLTDKMKSDLGVENISLDDSMRQGLIDSYNTKNIQLRWIKTVDKDEDDSSITNLTIASIMQPEQLPEKATIHWYKYNLSSEVSDELAGAFWEEMTEVKNEFSINFIPNVKKQTERIKVIIECPSKEYLEKNISSDEDVSYLQDKMTDDSLSYTEKEELEGEYSDLLNEYYGQSIHYESEIYTLTNESIVPDYNAIDLITGLKLEVDTSGYNGIYRIYDENGFIISSAEATKKRVITANYSSIVSGSEDLDKVEQITWLIPYGESSMIVEPKDGVEYDYDDTTGFGSDKVKKYPQGNGYICEITRYGVASTAAAGSIEGDSTQQVFRIQDYYSQSKNNNTIVCRVVKNNRVYEASAELQFAPSSVQGTDYSFVLQFTEKRDALNLSDGITPTTAIVEPHIYNVENTEVTDSFSDFTYSWYSEGNGGISLDAMPDGANYQSIKLTGTTMDECRHYILKCSVSGPVLVDGTTQKLTLIAYLAIPVRAIGYDYLSINGADQIRYDYTGTSPKYYSNNYTLYSNNNDNATYEKVPYVYWEMNFGDDSLDALKDNGKNFYPVISQDGKLTPSATYIENIGKQIAVEGYTATLIPETVKVYDTVYENRIDVNGNPYTTAKKVDTGKTTIEYHIGDDKKIIWSQPIRIFMDSYGSALLNSWDGSLTIDEENGIILSAMVGAGKKDNQNRFYGVLMGDVSLANESDNNGFNNTDYYKGIGLYGWHEGVKSFGLNINGKAFFGKSGFGQILIDGNEGVIQSSKYYQNGSGSDSSAGNNEGMKIDLNTGIIISKGPMGVYGTDGKETQALIKIDPTPGASILQKVTVTADTYETKKAEGLYYNKANGLQKVSTEEFSEDQTYLQYIVQSDTNPYFEIDSNMGHKLMFIGNKEYYLQSNNYEKNTSGFNLDLQNGTFLSYASYDTDKKIYSGSYVKIDPNGNPFFEIFDAWGGTTNTEKATGYNGQTIFYASAAKETLVDDTTQTTPGSFYLQSSNYNKKTTGMMINLSNGVIKTFAKTGSYVAIQGTTGRDLFVVYDATSKQNLIEVSDDGQTYYLQSSNYQSTASQSYYGCKLDLKNGTFISCDSNGGYVRISGSNNSSYFRITGKNGTELMNVGGTSYYLRSINYSTTNRTGMNIDIDDGTITSYSFNLMAYKGSSTSQYVQINSSAATYPIVIQGSSSQYIKFGWDGSMKTRAFAIDANGAITATSGTIGGWKIGKTTLEYSGNTTSTYITLDGANGIIKASNGSTKSASINSSGWLQATGATFNNCYITSNLYMDDGNSVANIVFPGGTISGNSQYAIRIKGNTSISDGSLNISTDLMSAICSGMIGLMSSSIIIGKANGSTHILSNCNLAGNLAVGGRLTVADSITCSGTVYSNGLEVATINYVDSKYEEWYNAGKAAGYASAVTNAHSGIDGS